MGRVTFSHPPCIRTNSVLDQLQKTRAVREELGMRNRHMAHLVERDIVLVLEENREHPRARFVGGKQANDIFATGRHDTIRATSGP